MCTANQAAADAIGSNSAGKFALQAGIASGAYSGLPGLQYSENAVNGVSSPAASPAPAAAPAALLSPPSIDPAPARPGQAAPGASGYRARAALLGSSSSASRKSVLGA